MCHVSNPKMLNDDQAKLLAKDIEKVTNIVRTNFHGRIYVFGPTPRHINSCCGQLKHTILDIEGERLDMVHYTNGVNEYLRQAISYPNKSEFISYQEQFGGEFVADMLTDGVHIDERVLPTLSGFIMGLLDRQAAPASPAVANVPTFRTILVKNGVKALGEPEMEDVDG